MNSEKGFAPLIIIVIITLIIGTGVGGFLVFREKKALTSQETTQQKVSSPETEMPIQSPETQVVSNSAQSMQPSKPKPQPESKPKSAPPTSPEKTIINEDKPPVLKNLGINIQPWDKTTNRAGDFEFKNKNYVDNKIFTEFAHKIVNDRGEKLLPEIGFNVPVGTKVVSPIDGVVTGVGFYEPSQDYIISMKTNESTSWIVGFEHIYNLRIKIGDKVLVGQELAEVSPSYGKTEFGNVEIDVWTGGHGIVKYCPFEFLDEPLKPMYEEKINQLAKDWEEFIGKDVYKQENWVAPGCLLHNIIERRP